MTGHLAAQPDPAWRPVPRRRGLIVTFVSEDGTQSKDFDFGVLPGTHGIQHDLAIAFEDATGVLGVSKRLRGPARCGSLPGMPAAGLPKTDQHCGDWQICPPRMPGCSPYRVGYPAALARRRASRHCCAVVPSSPTTHARRSHACVTRRTRRHDNRIQPTRCAKSPSWHGNGSPRA